MKRSSNPRTLRRVRAVTKSSMAQRALPASALGVQERLRVPKVAELVAKEIRGQIIRGELKAGQALPGEIALMAHFQISRQTLREALRVLESESLLSIIRGVNGGPRVCAPDPDIAARYFGLILQYQGTSLTDVIDARQLIEPPAARLATLRNRAKAPRFLRAIIEEEEALLADDEAFTQATIRFHESLVELADNQTLLLMLHTINGVLERHLSLVTIAASQTGDTTRAKRLGLKAQHKLVNLIEAGDAQQAEAFWQRNLEAIGKVLLRQDRFNRVVDVLE